ncbi:MAG: group II intron reverse transcriptase/maturase [Chloroflexota bacterium]
MAGEQNRTEDWKTLPWKQLQRSVFRLQKRIYQAEVRGDFKRVRNLQRLLLRSYSARCLAVRQVSQDNRGKNTPGVDGIARLTPKQRMRMVKDLRTFNPKPAPIRRVYIPKASDPKESRPLGIPTMRDRAEQALVKLALEPEWEARFEPNSYGFRPGRCAQDALEAIFNHIRLKPKYALEADIEKCFDRIDHNALLAKLGSIAPIQRQVRGWLKAGIFENGATTAPEAGTPQGGVISPLLANIALHGLETALAEASPKRNRPVLIRYADDFVILHEDLETLLAARALVETWLAGMGLALKPAKTCITHTLYEHEGRTGFDFLGFTVRQFPVGKHQGKRGYKALIKPSKKAQQRHLEQMGKLTYTHRGSNQLALIAALNPRIRGWTNYYRACSAKRIFNRMDHQLFWKLCKWAKWQTPRKSHAWRKQRYWHRKRNRLEFSDGEASLRLYADTHIRRHVKVQGTKSPYDGDWPYWIDRLGKDPSKSNRVIALLKNQSGRCLHCGLHFMADDLLETHHRDGDHKNNTTANLVLLHGHCHDEVHRTKYS